MPSDLPLNPVTASPPVASAGYGATQPLRLPGTGPDTTATAAPDVLARAAKRVADSLGSGNSFSFAVDNQTGITIVKIINKATGELVRQIPTEEVVHIAQLLQQDEHRPVLDVRV